MKRSYSRRRFLQAAAATAGGLSVSRSTPLNADPTSEPDEARIYGWGGVALYALFHTAFYLSAYVAFRLGWQPWA